MTFPLQLLKSRGMFRVHVPWDSVTVYQFSFPWKGCGHFPSGPILPPDIFPPTVPLDNPHLRVRVRSSCRGSVCVRSIC